MKTSVDKLQSRTFEHIYVEDEAMSYSLTKDILNRFSDSTVIPIGHYKDIFNRTHQDFAVQKHAPSLILAVKHGQLIYSGAKVCQSFGNDHFYYTSCIMNCLFDCEYCYLQGMYPSANIVIFVNQEDYFDAVSQLLEQHSVYLCVSYDTDLPALEHLTGFVKKWTDFTIQNPDLKIEVRTKSAATSFFSDYARSKNIIFAWTMSPDYIISKYEHNTPPLSARIKVAAYAASQGYPVRLCFDPMIYVNDYQKIYAEMYKEVFSVLNADDILDVSIGVFRISAEYVKSMRRKRLSAVTAFPYTNNAGVSSYNAKRSDEMISFARFELSKYISENKIYDI